MQASSSPIPRIGIWLIDSREANNFPHLANRNKWEEHNEPIRNRDKSMQGASSAGIQARIQQKQQPGNWGKGRNSAYELSAIGPNLPFD